MSLIKEFQIYFMNIYSRDVCIYAKVISMTRNENDDEICDNYNVISFSGFYYIQIVIG